MSPSRLPLWLKAVLAIILIEILGGLGAAITSSQIPDWYATLTKPPGTPPNAVFGPVWITLYAMMAVAFVLVWHHAPSSPSKTQALQWFAIQLSLNLAWTPVFFGMHRLFLALIVILALWIAIATTILHFRKQVPLASLLLLPYLAWVSYATYLNAGYWWLNR